MINKIKNYLEYRRNRKIAKTELVKLAAHTLPLIVNFSRLGSSITKSIRKITNESENIGGERLIEIVLSEISNVLQTNNSRLIEVLTYLAGLTPDEINDILIHSMAETINTSSKVDKSRKL